MKDERVDLSALDPARDAARWEGRIQAVVARAVEARRWSVAGQLSSWARPALALAAAAALFSWIGVGLSLRPAAESTPEDAVWMLSRWADSGEQPTAGNLLSVLGEQR
jgi:hypothetical protein